MTLTTDELNLLRQWYNAVCDLAPEYLEAPDHVLGKRITAAVVGEVTTGGKE